MKRRAGWFLILIILLIASPLSSLAQNKTKLKKGRVLIIYSGSEYQKGYQAAEKIKFYLRHFERDADLIPSSKYSSNLIGSYRWIFYVGVSKEAPNHALTEDLAATKRNVIWINDNLENFSNDFFISKGFILNKKASSRLVAYKKIFLPKDDKALNVIKITNSSKNIVFAKAVISKYKKSPYIINSKNFWYIADNPFENAKEGSSYLAFVDILHNIIEDHPHDRKATIRIDGVNPNSNSQKLQTIVDFLYFRKIPFSLSITPVYKKSPSSSAIYLHNKKELIEVIKYAQKKGAVLALNGYIFQANKTTGRDLEFGSNAKQIRLSTDKKVYRALVEMKKSGFNPVIWHTPYYQATPEDSQTFRRFFNYFFERGTEPPSPFVIYSSVPEQKVIPENLGYVAFNKTPKKETIPERAWRMQVIRDAYAGFSIQENISTEQLVDIIKRMQGMGYGFVSPYQLLGLKYRPPKEPFFGDYALYIVSERTDNLMANISWMILPTMFFSYYLIIFGLSRRLKPRPKKENKNLFFIFMVPALNEEKVIRKTLTKLISLPQENYIVLAINDNSKDNTENEMRVINSNKLKILTLTPPNCQQGKGNALNQAYKYVLSDTDITHNYSPENVIMAVVDSDGSVDPQIIPSVTPYFDDLKSASVQTTVRIENANQNIWTKWQEFEFGVFTYLFQSAREQLGSVGLGGNGQFIRLSALQSLGEAPWTKCLTEDLDIGIRLILGGWRNHFCSTSYVYQQGVPKFWPLVKQRTRWFQGHVQCWRHLGRIAIKRLPILAKVDITYYLLSISLALIIVPANFLMAFQASYLAANPDLFRFLAAIFGAKIFFYWYFIYFGAMPVFTYAYWRAKKQSLIKAVVLSHLFLFVSLVWLVAGYLAIFRLFRKTTNWHKTVRS